MLSIYVNGQRALQCHGIDVYIYKSRKIVNNDGSMGQPWGIAVGGHGMWAVTDQTKCCVYVFDCENKLRSLAVQINKIVSLVLLMELHLIKTITYLWLTIITTECKSLTSKVTIC